MGFNRLCTSLFFIVLCSHLAAFAEDKTPPSISSLRLLNPVVGAGEALDLRVVASDPESGFPKTSGSGIWLGMVIQNVFRDSDALNRSLTALGSSEFRVAELTVNPWVAPYRPVYTIMEFYLFDNSGNRASLAARSEQSTYYINEKGETTSIPVIHFSTKPNPQADAVPPVIYAIKASKEFFAPGEELQLTVAGQDNLAGIQLGCCAGIATTPYIISQHGGVNGSVSLLGKKVYRVSGFRIDTTAPEGRVVIDLFGFKDRAGNFTQLRRKSSGDQYYTNEKGELTKVPVTSFMIKK